MKLKFQKSTLINGINIVLKAIPSKTTLPILECVLISAEDGMIKLTANDMELAIETKVAGEIVEEGRIAVDAKLFSEIVRKLPESELSVETDSAYQVLIRCEKAKFQIPGQPGDDFVFLPEVEKQEYVSLSQFSLKETIRQTIFSIGISESNRMMSGEYLQVSGNDFSLTSLDGHRISIRRISLSESFDSRKVIVPGKTLNEISRILPGDVDKTVFIFFSRNHVSFEFDDTIVVSRVIDGEYFNTSQMVSGDYNLKVTVNKKDFLDSIERSVLLIRESDKKPIVFTIGEESMELSMNSSIGSMNEELPIRKSGPELKIAFNPRFFIDALRVIDEEEVTIYMTNAKAPCIIRPEDGSYIYLILPVSFIA